MSISRRCRCVFMVVAALASCLTRSCWWCFVSSKLLGSNHLVRKKLHGNILATWKAWESLSLSYCRTSSIFVGVSHADQDVNNPSH